MSVESFYNSISTENISNGKKNRETKTPRKFLSFSVLFLSKKIRKRPHTRRFVSILFFSDGNISLPYYAIF
jgi:hypothetical protein